MSTSELSTVAEAHELSLLARLEFKFEDLNQEYHLTTNGQAPNLNTSKKFKVDSDGKIFQGQIMIKDQCHYNATYVHRERKFVFVMENVEKMFVKYVVHANGLKHVGHFVGEEIPLLEGYKAFGNMAHVDIPQNWKTFRGCFDIQFLPTTTAKPIRELILKKVLEMSDPDCSIVCQGETFKFNKLILCSVSMVFEKMFENSDYKEASNGSVIIDDFQPETIEGFKNTITALLANNFDELKKTYLTPQLLLFADKYAIQCLVDAVGTHLKKSLSMYTVYEVIDAAFLTNNDDLLKTAVQFLKENLKKLDNESEIWKKLHELDHKCFVLIMKYMI